MLGAEVRSAATTLARMSQGGVIDYGALAMASRRVRDIAGRLATRASALNDPIDDALALRAVHDILEALIDSKRADAMTVRLVAFWLDFAGQSIEGWDAGAHPAEVLAFPGPRPQLAAVPPPRDPDPESAA